MILSNKSSSGVGFGAGVTGGLINGGAFGSGSPVPGLGIKGDGGVLVGLFGLGLGANPDGVKGFSVKGLGVKILG